MDCKLISYNASNEFQNNVYWATNPNYYKNVIWLNVEFPRPRFDEFQEVSEDELKNRTIVYQRQRAEISFYIMARNYLLDFLTTLGLNDTVILEILETGEQYQLNNLRFEDTTDESDVVGSVKFTFDMQSITASGCGETNYELVPC